MQLDLVDFAIFHWSGTSPPLWIGRAVEYIRYACIPAVFWTCGVCHGAVSWFSNYFWIVFWNLWPLTTLLQNGGAGFSPIFFFKNVKYIYVTVTAYGLEWCYGSLFRFSRPKTVFPSLFLGCKNITEASFPPDPLFSKTCKILLRGRMDLILFLNKPHWSEVYGKIIQKFWNPHNFF